MEVSEREPRIVLVDDDPLTGKIMRVVLEEEGYDVAVATRAAQSFALVLNNVTDLVVLDVKLPDMDGFSLASDLRARRYVGPIMFVSGFKTLDARLEGFRLMADDYIVKPFEPLEFVARVGSVLRRSRLARREPEGMVLAVGDARLSLNTLRYCSAAVEDAELTPTEQRFLEHLMRAADHIVTREHLIEAVWGLAGIDDTNRVDVYVRRVRRKIERDPTSPEYLHTLRGVGYVFRSPIPGASHPITQVAHETTDALRWSTMAAAS